jgi:hypothetical protein
LIGRKYVKEFKIKGTVVKEGERWYIKDGERYQFAGDLLTGIDSICMNYGDYMIAEGEEIEVIIKVKDR